MFRRGRDDRSLGKFFLGNFLALILLVAALLSAAPQLHERLHRDADTSSHQCIVTLIGSGHCQQTALPPVAAPLARLTLLVTRPASSASVLVVTPCSSILEHAPPVFA
ncbi:MAG: hypothetical protein ACRD5Z_14810 [Bryobacteraceae bacterium]